MVEERKAEILRAIVEEYVASAQPVGSKHIADSRDLGVSSATIRNDMSSLEAEGYIAQPHTSAGRVPTDLGYRFYVDRLADPGILAPSQRREVAAFFASTVRAIDDLLAETSMLLADLTTHAALVVGPGVEVGRIRSAQLVPLEDDLVLVVVVLSDGAIAREMIRLTTPASDSEIAQASHVLDASWKGRSLSEVPSKISPADDLAPEVAALVVAAHDVVAGQQRENDPVFVGGASRLAAESDAFSSADAPARVIKLLEEHAVLTALMRELLGPGLTIRIGSENARDDLVDCSLVLAPYLVEGEVAGSVGILGPTRMDYRLASAAVEAVSRQLGRSLTR